MNSSIKLKICGITQPLQALEIASLGVHAIGVIAVKNSPRFITSYKRHKLFQSLEEFYPNTKRVLVVANINDHELEETMSIKGSPSIIQLHGDESIEECQRLRLKYPDIELWKAFRIRSKPDLVSINNYAKTVDSFLLDSWSNDALGGTGHKIQTKFINSKGFEVPFWMAGGICAEWIPELLKTIKPFGIDASSKLEKSPGIKDIKKVKDLIKAIEVN
tara:strand:+ start:6725 stop:7378 length:654 start_codon:yes stop_codon:yes gene_type:complete